MQQNNCLFVFSSAGLPPHFVAVEPAERTKSNCIHLSNHNKSQNCDATMCKKVFTHNRDKHTQEKGKKKAWRIRIASISNHVYVHSFVLAWDMKEIQIHWTRKKSDRIKAQKFAFLLKIFLCWDVIAAAATPLVNVQFVCSVHVWVVCASVRYSFDHHHMYTTNKILSTPLSLVCEQILIFLQRMCTFYFNNFEKETIAIRRKQTKTDIHTHAAKPRMNIAILPFFSL